MIPGLARKRKGNRGHPLPPKRRISLLFLTHRFLRPLRTGMRGNRGCPLPQNKTAIPLLFWTHRFLRPLRTAVTRVIRRRRGGGILTLFPDLTFTAFLDAPFLATTPHGCDPLDAPDGLGLQSRTAASTFFYSGRPQTNSLLIQSASVSPKRGAPQSPVPSAAPVLHCGSPQPKARWSQERR